MAVDDGTSIGDDLAWVESCFINDSSALDSGWNALRDALIEPEPVNVHDMLSDEGDETDDGLGLSGVNDSGDDFWATHNKGDVFLPTYRGEFQSCESEMDHQWDDPSLPLEEIFKTWDLDVPAVEEEVGLAEQLNKVLGDGSTPTRGDVLPEWDSSYDEFFDEIISGIADLSLS
ncbi:hypothetical protein M569_08378 [Genlisea aurea]|uniref:Uncharacterized protein n=1 Tax=Genlisea aurea TaxID=192259 RepID=S8CHI4_9LAMI|nr:hypothetical protein M569_08378 [Genlisea aurea]